MIDDVDEWMGINLHSICVNEAMICAIEMRARLKFTGESKSHAILFSLFDQIEQKFA